MTKTYTFGFGHIDPQYRPENTEELEIVVSDRIAEAVDTSGTGGENYELAEILQDVATQYPDHGTFRLFENNPVSQELTQRFLDTSWGTKYLADLNPPIQSLIVEKAMENPDKVQVLIEEYLEHSITKGSEAGEFLLKQAQENPEDVILIIRILYNT